MARSGKFTGFVLESFPLSDHRHVVTVFTESGGKRKGVFRVSKTQPQAYLTPLTRLSFQLSGKEHHELSTMSQISLDAHVYDVGSRYAGLILLQHWAFLLKQSQPDEHEDPKVFRLVNHCVAGLGRFADKKKLFLANLYFESWLLHFCGVLPRSSFQEGPDSQETRLWRSMEPELLASVFQQKIEEFLDHALKLGSLAGSEATLGTMWEHFLGREVRTRKLLLAELKENQRA